MSYDEQPAAPLHGECAAEIHRLEKECDEFRAALNDDFSEAKDWKLSNNIGRIEWMKSIIQSGREESERMANEIVELRAENARLKLEADPDALTIAFLKGSEKAAEFKRRAESAEAKLAALSQQEPVAWEYRTYYGNNTSNPGWGNWETVIPRNHYTDTVADAVAEIKHYIEAGHKYELRAFYTAAPPILEQEPIGFVQGIRIAQHNDDGSIYYPRLEEGAYVYYGPAPAQEVPEGYWLAPMEPTMEMCQVSDQPMAAKYLYRAMRDAAIAGSNGE